MARTISVSFWANLTCCSAISVVNKGRSDPDGAMWAYSTWGNAAQMYTSLAGISFPLGS